MKYKKTSHFSFEKKNGDRSRYYPRNNGNSRNIFFVRFMWEMSTHFQCAILNNMREVVVNAMLKSNQISVRSMKTIAFFFKDLLLL